MNDTQRKARLVTAIVVALMVIPPPYEVKNHSQMTIMSGYEFLFDLPAYVAVNDPLGILGQIPASVDIKTLLVQIFGVAIVGGLLFLANSRKA